MLTKLFDMKGVVQNGAYYACKKRGLSVRQWKRISSNEPSQDGSMAGTRSTPKHHAGYLLLEIEVRLDLAAESVRSISSSV